MKTPLIRLSFVHDVRAPENTKEGKWHVAWRLHESRTIAFYFKRQWWASTSAQNLVGPFTTLSEAVKTPYTAQ